MDRRRTSWAMTPRRLFTGIGDMYGNPFTDRWPGYDPAYIAYVFTLTIPAGESRALMTFVVKGMSEASTIRAAGLALRSRTASSRRNTTAPYRGVDTKIPAARI